MFNPSSYRDSDYGLDTGETFEPGDADDVLLADTSLPHVMTVLGPIEPDELSVCLTQEYLLERRRPGDGKDSDSAPGHLDQAAQDLESFAFSGGRSVVDTRTADQGRDAARLYELAQRVPLHIIATTGRHGRPELGDRVDADALGAEFIGDLTVGMDGTDSLSGLIAVEVAVDGSAWGEHPLIRAAAMAHRATGTPVAVHSGTPATASHTLEALEREGVAPHRVILRGMGRGVSAEEVIALAVSGAAVTVGGIGEGGTDGGADQAHAIIRVFEAGFGDSVLISRHHEAPSSPCVGDGTFGLNYLLERFALTLMEAGAEAAMVRQLFVENPRRALSVFPKGRE